VKNCSSFFILSATEKKTTFQGSSAVAFPVGVAPLRSPKLVCGLILNTMLADIREIKYTILAEEIHVDACGMKSLG